MFSKTQTEKYTNACSQNINKLRAALSGCDSVVIGAGAGLSASAGFTYGGERFKNNFADFEAQYGFHDMYTGGFYPYETPEEYWAYWSRYIYINRYSEPPKRVYEDLLKAVKGRDYFVITTNVDHCFQKAGFDKNRLFYAQGDYGLWQCSVPCCNKTYDNEKTVRLMVEAQKNRRVPAELIPHCPVCGAPMTMNLRADDKFAEDSGWHSAARRYRDFLSSRSGGKLLFLELGVGCNTPAIIKYPFWQMTAQNQNAFYACINHGEAFCPEEISARAVCINADIAAVLNELA